MAVDINFLTSKQKKVYHAIESYIKSRGIPPTVREIGEQIGEKTPGAVQGILNRLEQKGVIKREVGMARSIQIVTDDSLYVDPIYVPEIKKITMRNVDDLLNMYNINRYQPIAPSVVKSDGEVFIINCPDNSLAQSNIKYGDMLIVCTTCEFSEGDIVIVLYDTHVLLRYYNGTDEKNFIKLTAESDIFGKEIFAKDEVRIVGKVIGKYTSYN